MQTGPFQVSSELSRPDCIPDVEVASHAQSCNLWCEASQPLSTQTCVVLGTAGFFAGVNPVDIHIPSLEGLMKRDPGSQTRYPAASESV